jgi:hypothetical protein
MIAGDLAEPNHWLLHRGLNYFVSHTVFGGLKSDCHLSLHLENAIFTGRFPESGTNPTDVPAASGLLAMREWSRIGPIARRFDHVV